MKRDPESELTLEFQFGNPPQSFGPRPLWFWNGALSPGEIKTQIQSIHEAGNSGFGIVPAYGMFVAGSAENLAELDKDGARQVFMSAAYLDAYAVAVQSAADFGLRVCLYDEFWFPSGWAAGQIASEFPEALSKRLDQHATELAGPTRYSKRVPDGKLMAAVAMNLQSRERISLLDSIQGGWLTWEVPAGRWRVMFFTCVTDGAKGLIDYLDPKAVDAFLGLTYDKYYERFPEHFGSTIDLGFYDEPTLHWVEGGRSWTPEFNERFVERYGTDPDLLYPALWLDIGPETASARQALFALRAALFSTTYIKRMNDWCRSKGMQLTGHVDQEEIANPVGLCGDLMKTFEHQDIPAFDQIFSYGRVRKVAKVVTSAAVNYDRQLVACECYGATEGLEKRNARELYREAIDLFSRGMNVLMPHAIWYDASAMEFPPNVSLSDPDFGPHIADFNLWVSRVQNILQRGVSLAEVGVLYPIDTLMSNYRFDGGGDPYEGGMSSAADELAREYLDVGDVLVTEVHRDFMYVHPEVLNKQCVVGKNAFGETILRLSQASGTEPQEFRAFVLPGLTHISLENLVLLKSFHDAGGVLIATKRLPEQAVVTGSIDDIEASTSASVGRASFSTGSAERLPSDMSATERSVTERSATERSAPDRRASAGTVVIDPSVNNSDARSPTLRSRAIAASLQVQKLIDEIFGAEGCGEFVLTSDAKSIRSILDKRLPVGDVLLDVSIDSTEPAGPYALGPGTLGGHVSYLRKMVDGKNIYFFGNSMYTGVTLAVKLRGTHRLAVFDPGIGEMRDVPFHTIVEHDEVERATTERGPDEHSETISCFELKLGPVEALFVFSQ